MGDQSHIMFSYSFDDEGKSLKLDNKQVAKEVENEGLTWVHLDANNKLTKTWLNQEVYYLDHLIIDALIAEETRPRIIEFASGILVILRGISKDEKSQEMVSVRMWIDSQRVITIQRKQMKAVWDIRQNIDLGKTIKNSGEFLYNLLYQILNDTSEKVHLFNEKIDNLEDKIITTHNIKFREKILKIRSQSATFKRYLLPQKEVISKLRSSNQIWIDDWVKRHFQENFDQISHIIEEVDEAINRSQILHEELANALSEKLNKSMYKLSLITVIFMPLTFVAGLFGMNVGGIPGNQNPFAFYICSGLMIVVALFHVLSFKKKDWF
jgi:zinc transporter